MSDSLVSVNAVNKIYQRGGEKLVVLDDLNLEVPKGDFLALDHKKQLLGPQL